MTGIATADLLASFSPWLAFDATGDLAIYLSALGGMRDTVAGIVTDQGYPEDADYVPGWSTLLDPDACPAMFLPFLAQFNGTIVPPGTDEADARMIIKAEAGFQRGTGYYGPPSASSPSGAGNGAMYQAALRNLTGTRFLIFRERTAASGLSDPYHVVIAFHPQECPSVPALTTAVEAVKPAGIQVTYLSATGFSWNTAINTWSQDTFSWIQSATTQP